MPLQVVLGETTANALVAAHALLQVVLEATHVDFVPGGVAAAKVQVSGVCTRPRGG